MLAAWGRAYIIHNCAAGVKDGAGVTEAASGQCVKTKGSARARGGAALTMGFLEGCGLCG